MHLEQLSEFRSDLWIVDAIESCQVIGIGIGIDFEVGHSVSIPIPIPNMSISGLPRNGIRLQKRTMFKGNIVMATAITHR
ncbi:hypothetical protein D3OALGA1CA_2113 [Olavius algarvensis associated proteobacterium Delta 3]|nr:hypothetical protein D3OALGA1CA_2113 [Olavius algarvensis associated proteobacterium Delta 3]